MRSPAGFGSCMSRISFTFEPPFSVRLRMLALISSCASLATDVVSVYPVPPNYGRCGPAAGFKIQVGWPAICCRHAEAPDHWGKPNGQRQAEVAETVGSGVASDRVYGNTDGRSSACPIGAGIWEKGN